MSKTISNVGELRQFLANAIIAVKNGEMKAQEAQTIQKIAAQINESFYSEIKVAQIRRALGDEASLFPTGQMKINA